MDEDDCDGCEECLADLTVPSRRWRWLDMGIVFVDVAAETALAVARGFAAISDLLRAHYNYTVDEQTVAESGVISLTGE